VCRHLLNCVSGPNTAFANTLINPARDDDPDAEQNVPRKYNSRPYAACAAYLRGLFDGMQQVKIVDLKDTFCPPPTTETDQLRLIIEEWIRDNPKNLNVSVAWAVPLALSLAFQCPK
jgi:Ssp1 endopeptidase immunity protein Rap1a